MRFFLMVICTFTVAACGELIGGPVPYDLSKSMLVDDKTIPEVKITTTETVVSTSPFILKGTAKDEGGKIVSGSWINSANKGDGSLTFPEAKSEVEWTASVPLVVGRNPIAITVEDESGNISDLATYTVVYDPTVTGGTGQTVTLQISGGSGAYVHVWDSSVGTPTPMPLPVSSVTVDACRANLHGVKGIMVWVSDLPSAQYWGCDVVAKKPRSLVYTANGRTLTPTATTSGQCHLSNAEVNLFFSAAEMGVTCQ